LNGNRQATVELGEEQILVRHGEQWLDLKRAEASVSWQREDGRSGTLVFTEAGTLRGEVGEEEMDMAAERWARDLMRESPQGLPK
jgi:hypothetical protein